MALPNRFWGDGMIGGSFYERINGQAARLNWSKPKNKSFLSFSGCLKARLHNAVAAVLILSVG
jgi:hypothetical protein